MRTSFGTGGLALTCGLALVLGCARSAPTVADSSLAPPTATLGAVHSMGDRVDAFAAIYEVTFDPDTLVSTVRLLETRSGQQNDDLYGLDVGRFFGAEDLQIFGIERESSSSALHLRWGVSHPFAPPTNLDGPASAANRADLGIAGQLVYLIDVPNASDHTYFDDVIANAEVVQNADSYVRPAGMLPTSLTANTFPAQSIIDERGIGNRAPISNGGSVFGNYGTDGWTRDEMGTNRDNWTGYGVLHQGQFATGTLTLDTRVLQRDGPITFDIAVLVRYNDPRNASNQAERIARRLPPATPDPLVFAYRMPHGSLDCSDTEVEINGGPIVANDFNTAVDLDLFLTDWDARAVVTSEADLSQETEVTKVAVGERGFPIGELDFPRIAGDNPQPVLLDANGATGSPDDPLHYTVVLTNEITADQRPGIAAGLVRWIDPENDLTPSLVTPLDSATLLPLTSDLPEAIYYGAIRIDIQPTPTTWAREIEGSGGIQIAGGLAIDPGSGQTWLTGSFNGSVDLDPGSGQFIRVANGERDVFIARFTQDGEFEDAITFGGPDAEYAVMLDRSRDGDVRVVGTFTGTVDFDPGPGTQSRSAGAFAGTFCLSLDGEDLTYQWVDVWGETGDIYGRSIVSDGFGRPFVCGTFLGPTDFDPGPDTDSRNSVGGLDAFCVALDSDGGYRWATTLGSNETENGGVPAIASGDHLLWPGFFMETVDFDPGAGTEERTAVSANGDAFLLELDATGAFQRVLTLGGGFSTTIVKAVTTRPADTGVMLTGRFTDTIDFDPGVADQSRPGTNPGDWFVLALDNTWQYQWVATAGAETSNEEPVSLATTPAGGVRILGFIQGGSVVDFDPGPGVANFTNKGVADRYLWALDASGTYEWTRQIGGLISGVTPVFVATAPDGSFRECGSFNNSVDVDVDPAPGRTEFLFANTVDIYFAKYSATGTWVP